MRLEDNIAKPAYKLGNINYQAAGDNGANIKLRCCNKKNKGGGLK